MVKSDFNKPYITHKAPFIVMAAYGIGLTSLVLFSALNCFMAVRGARKTTWQATGGATFRNVSILVDKAALVATVFAEDVADTGNTPYSIAEIFVGDSSTLTSVNFLPFREPSERI